MQLIRGKDGLFDVLDEEVNVSFTNIISTNFLCYTLLPIRPLSVDWKAVHRNVFATLMALLDVVKR